MKIPRFIALGGIVLLSTAFFPPLLSAQEEFVADPLGVCPLYNLSGYTTIDAQGNLVNLMDYCQGLHPAQSGDQFWESFVAAADEAAIAQAETLGRQEVLAYGNTICPFLKNGGTLSELRQVQSDQSFPPTFDVAVTLAAIHTYCPTYQTEIGH